MNIKRCVYCNCIPNQYYQDWEGSIVCVEHINYVPSCLSCHKFLRENGENISNDRYVCYNCLQNQVNDSNIQRHIDHVYQLLYDIGFCDIQRDHIDIKLISYQEMKNECPNDKLVMGYHLGYSDIEDKRGRSGFHQTIRILDSLHYIVFEATLAHELLHAWQLQQNIQDYNRYNNELSSQYKIRTEGFAQLGIAIVYKHFFAREKHNKISIGLTDIQKMCRGIQTMELKQKDLAYGKMYEKIYARVKKNGWRQIIKEAREDRLKEYV